MELNEKLQELRKRKGLTQEELAQQLYVSRTAISKWESGRGLPSIESLKAIATFFCISLDELLSGEELLVIAETDHRQREKHIQDLVFGLLDCAMALLLFLPFFGQPANGLVQEVSLLALTDIRSYLKAAYFAAVFATVTMGILTLALQNCRQRFWMQGKGIFSLALSAAAICLFIISRQPYPAVFAFVFFLIKGIMLGKRR